MIDDMVRVFGLREGRPLVARLTTPWPAGRAGWRVRLWVPLFFLRASLAGGLLLVELSVAALRSSSAMRRRVISFGAAFSRASAEARRSTPWPHSRRATTIVVATEDGSRRSCSGEGLVAGGEVRQWDTVTAPRPRRPSRHSPGGKAS